MIIKNSIYSLIYFFTHLFSQFIYLFVCLFVVGTGCVDLFSLFNQANRLAGWFVGHQTATLAWPLGQEAPTE